MELYEYTCVLVMPSMKHRQATIDYINEFARFGEAIDGTGLSTDMGRDFDAYGEWITRFYPMDEGEAGRGGGCSFTYFFMDKEEKLLVGTVNIRYGNKIEEEFGNIGYAIRPSLRGKGYGKQLLELTVAMCDFMGMDGLTAVTKPDNYPSIRVLQSCDFSEMKVLDNGNVKYQRGENNA